MEGQAGKARQGETPTQTENVVTKRDADREPVSSVRIPSLLASRSMTLSTLIAHKSDGAAPGVRSMNHQISPGAYRLSYGYVYIRRPDNATE
jgi:hypothetical protein